MYYGKKAVLLLDGYRRAMKREQQNLLKLLRKSGTTKDELAQQIKKMRDFERQSLVDSIIIIRTMTTRLPRLNLMAMVAADLAASRLKRMCDEVDGTLNELEPKS